MDAAWDAGEAGCARFVLELRQRVLQLEPGQRLRLTARDPGVAQDLAAWCRMTGHRLLEKAPPHYVIQRAAAPSAGTGTRRRDP